MSLGYANVPAPVVEEAEKAAKANGSTLAHVSGLDDVMDHVKILEATATKDDVLSAPFEGAERIEDPETGEWTLNVPQTERNAGISRELMQRQWRAETERGDKVQSLTPMVRVRNARGETVEIPASTENVMARGPIEMHAAPRWGGCEVKRFSDGMLWRKVGVNWESTRRCCLGTPLKPCGRGGCEACG